MIQPATKYASLPRAAASRPPAPVPSAARPGSLPGRAAPSPAVLNIVNKRAKAMTPAAFQEWMFKACRPGGELHEYERRERARTSERYRAVARQQHGFQQNNKSDLRRVADIPARDYFRWLREDPDFFHDNKNLKSLKRDNSDVCVYL